MSKRSCARVLQPQRFLQGSWQASCLLCFVLATLLRLSFLSFTSYFSVCNRSHLHQGRAAVLHQVGPVPCRVCAGAVQAAGAWAGTWQVAGGLFRAAVSRLTTGVCALSRLQTSCLLLLMLPLPLRRIACLRSQPPRLLRLLSATWVSPSASCSSALTRGRSPPPVLGR